MPPTRQSRPSATNAEPAESNSAGGLKLAFDSISGDPRHEGFNAGYALGKMERFEAEVEDYARALLHERSREMLGFARRLAGAKGPNWQALIVWSGEADD